MMKVDKERTKIARAKHAAGIARLNELFGVSNTKIPFNPQTGRAFADKKTRRLWREWRDSTFEKRIRRRRQRSLARASRKAHRP